MEVAGEVGGEGRRKEGGKEEGKEGGFTLAPKHFFTPSTGRGQTFLHFVVMKSEKNKSPLRSKN